MSRSWCRLYTGTRNHRKIKLLREEHPHHWTYWYVLIELAGEINDGGWIYVAPGVPFTDKQLANELGFERVTSWLRLCSTLVRLQLVTVCNQGLLLNSFAERNFESDNSTPRVQKHRLKSKQQDNDETFRRNDGVTHQNRTEQNRTDNPPTPQRGNGVNGFDEFWLAYPKKVGKQDAIRKWKNLRKSGRLPPVGELVTALERQKTWEQWQKDGGQFIPNPATWLNQGRWEDQPTEEGKPQWVRELLKEQSTN
jgi:hypothetical protein